MLSANTAEEVNEGKVFLRPNLLFKGWWATEVGIRKSIEFPLEMLTIYKNGIGEKESIEYPPFKNNILNKLIN